MAVPGGGGQLAEAVARAGGEPVVVPNLSQLFARLGESPWAATIISVDLPEADLDIIGRLTRETAAGAVVVVTEQPSATLMLGAARIGVKEVVAAKGDEERLEGFLVSLLGEADVVPVPDDDPAETLVGSSSALLDVFKQAGRVAGSDATVLVTGESGTGKELVARAIHEASQRTKGAFVAVNCAAIPEDLLESELFGHERGAFTGAVARKIGRFERAHGGTLFLDEIGDMSLVLQAKILRALQEREIERVGGDEVIPVDARVIAATHRDLGALVATGEFREDLFYRLAVVRLHLPALRDRADDVRQLALFLAARLARQHGREIRGIARQALDRIAAHAWPGNVREVRNVMERAVLRAPGPVIGAGDIELDSQASPEGRIDGTFAGYPPSLSMAEVEALHIARVLREVDGHMGRAAEVLGMHRNTISRKAREYGLAEGS